MIINMFTPGHTASLPLASLSELRQIKLKITVVLELLLK